MHPTRPYTKGEDLELEADLGWRFSPRHGLARHRTKNNPFGDFFFFYGGSLMDVASQTAWRNSPLSSACLPASTVETPIHSPMSCVHLLLGLPLPLLPSHVPSKNSFSNMLCRLMWPKYNSFCFLIRFRSCGAFTPSCSRTLVFVFLSVHGDLGNVKELHHTERRWNNILLHNTVTRIL